MNNVIGIVVTYNRKELLVKNIEKLIEQTYKLDILIVDNNSNDGTYDEIKKYLNSNIMYINTGKNIGGAGGFYTGVKYAYENNYNYFWLMDDDGRPYDNSTLENIMKIADHKKEKNFIINSLIICDDKKTLSFGLPSGEIYKEIIEKANNGIIWNEANPFNGTLVAREVVKNIGYPKKEFFISGDETEYMLRAQKNGYKIMTCVDSIYYHPQPKRNEISFFGKKINTREQTIWRTYYNTRNYSYIAKQYSRFPGKIKYIIRTLFMMVFIKNNRAKKYKAIIIGMIDGFREKFDREISLER